MTGRLNCQVLQFVCVLDFLEICERRNLFTQNAGIVNQRYLSKCQGTPAIIRWWEGDDEGCSYRRDWERWIANSR